MRHALSTLREMAVITYREMAPAELPGRATEIDVSEHGAVVYTWIEGELKAAPEAWDRPRWTAETWRQEK